MVGSNRLYAKEADPQMLTLLKFWFTILRKFCGKPIFVWGWELIGGVGTLFSLAQTALGFSAPWQVSSTVCCGMVLCQPAHKGSTATKPPGSDRNLAVTL